MNNHFVHYRYPYHTLSDYYKKKYGDKVYKLAIDGGFTCPNRDGSIHDKGCIFCSSSGSGDFASKRELNMATRVAKAKALIQGKTKALKFIVYFQSFTNTYAQVDKLRTIYESALIDDSIVGLSIATRPDCLSEDIINLMIELSLKVDIYVELGLQTIHSNSAKFIRRGYHLDIYDKAIRQLNKANIPVITHVIIGLPGEKKADILDTIKYVAKTNTHGIKLQLLHILTDTDLYEQFKIHPFHILSMHEYIDYIISSIQLLPPSMVIHRLTGDGPKHLLFEPKWSLDKKRVLGTIAKQFKLTSSYQGQYFKEESDD